MSYTHNWKLYISIDFVHKTKSPNMNFSTVTSCQHSKLTEIWSSLYFSIKSAKSVFKPMGS